MSILLFGHLLCGLSFFNFIIFYGEETLSCDLQLFLSLRIPGPTLNFWFLPPLLLTKKKKFLFCFCSECGFSFSSLLTSYVSASCQLLSIPFSCCWIFNPNSTNIFPRKEELQKVKWMEENEAVLYNIKPGSGMASHVFTLSISPLNNMSLS